MHEDQLINRSHGDKIVCGDHGKLSFVFRAGPVSSHAKYNWGGCSCAHSYWRGHQGKVTKAVGGWRTRRGSHRLKQSFVSHEEDGFKVRGGWKNLHLIYQKWWDDMPPAHSEKNWKRHRKTQWKPGEG